MEKTTSPTDSVTNEDYKGPSVTTAIAGEGYLAHFQFAITGLLVGGIGSLIFHKQVNKAVNAMREGSAAFRENGGKLKQFVGGFGGWVFGRGEKEFAAIKSTIHPTGPTDKDAHEILMMLESKEKGIGHWLADHALPFVSKAKKRELISRDGRYEAAAIGGGLLGSIGFFLSPAFFAHSGYRKGVAGKDQFARAQDEILTTRAERDALRGKYADTLVELEALKKTPGAPGNDHAELTVSQDNPPKIGHAQADATAAALSQADSPTGPTAPPIEPAPTTGRTLPGPAPRVQEPVMGPDQVEGWTARESTRDAEAAAYHDAAR